jgi:hypothetical protein
MLLDTIKKFFAFAIITSCVFELRLRNNHMRTSSFHSFMYAPAEKSGNSIFSDKTKSRYIRKRITAREFPHFSYSPVYVTASNNLKPKLQPMNGCNVFSLCSGDYLVVWIKIGILIHF